MRDKLLKKLAGIHTNHPWRMLIITIVVTLLFGFAAEHLKMSMRWSDMLPEKDVRTQQFNEIIEDFNSATSIVVVVQGDENRIKKFADDIAPQIKAAYDTANTPAIQKKIESLKAKALKAENAGKNSDVEKFSLEIAALENSINKKYFNRVDYKTEIDFIKNHGLMLVKEDDLKNVADMYTSANLVDFVKNLNNSLEKEYVGREESISTRQKEDEAVRMMDGIESFINLLQAYSDGKTVSDEQAKAAVEKLLVGDPYLLSYDKSTLLINIIPNFALTELEYVIPAAEYVQGLVDHALQQYPDVQAGLTGMVAVAKDEMVYSEQSLGSTSLIAFIAILILLIATLRMWAAPLLAGVNLIVGIVWATGLAAITVGELNMMTSMFGVILIGLGIDFSVHIISGFTENRALGLSILESLEQTLTKIGKGVITGGITTSVAFLALMVGSSRGMKEMGLVAGLGLLAVLVSTFVFLPTLLVFRERRLQKKNKEIQVRNISFKFLGNTANAFGNRSTTTLIVSLAISAVLVFFATQITFDHNYMNIEPKGIPSVTLQDTIVDKFDMGMDYSMVLANSIDESRKFAKECRDLGSVAMVEDISAYLPSPEEQQKRRPYLNNIKNALVKAPIVKSVSKIEYEKLIGELERLEMNVIEIQDMAFLGGQDKVDTKAKKLVGDPESDDAISIISTLVTSLQDGYTNFEHFHKVAAPHFKETVQNMCNTNDIVFDDLPVTILDRYCNDNRDKFLVTVFPAGGIWTDARLLETFVEDVASVSDKATGMPPVFRALIEVIGSDGKKAALLTIVVMFIFLVIDFRHAGYALMAMIPLGVGIFWMVGLMELLGLQLTAMNVMGIPMIIGIGIDDGVHIIHRWLSEGKSKLNIVFSSTGKAILLTSLTTMLGFGSLVFSIWRGFAQLGSALFIGVAACFLTTVIILPGILAKIKK